MNMNKLLWAVLGGILTSIIAAQALAGTITVGPGGGYDYQTIQHAIYAAASGDVVEVADGLYTGPGNRDIEFCGKGITVRGLNGPGNCIIDCGGSYDDPHRGFVFHAGEGSSAILEGLTIQNGYAYEGGGIYCYQSSPTIRNCLIQGNAAAEDGGGINCRYSNPVITHCVIRQNTAGDTGGGIGGAHGQIVFEDNLIEQNSANRGAGMGASDCDTVIRRSRFVNNRTPEVLGALGGGLVAGRGNFSVVDCLFAGNWCGEDGGGLWTYEGTGVIARNVFVGNTARVNGGAVDLHDDTQQLFAQNVVVANTVTGVPGYSGGNAGGVRIHSCDGQVQENIIVGNSAHTGGGIGSVEAFDHETHVTNNLIAGNVATRGGGISLMTKAVWIEHCTLAANSGSVGSSLFCAAEQAPLLRNSILWGSGQQIRTENCDVDVGWCDVAGWLGGPGNIDADPLFLGGPSGTWDLDGQYDPNAFQTILFGGTWKPGALAGKCINPDTAQGLQFLIVGNDGSSLTVWGDAAGLGEAGDSFQVYDYHLTGLSPCIDAGCDSCVPVDLDFRLRPFDAPGVDPNGQLPDYDMGAYEYAGLFAPPGDANMDGCVDGLDYVVWSNNYSQNGKWWRDGDFTGDAAVDGLDYVVWSNNYCAGCPGSPGAPIPEPATLALLALGGLVLIRRRRK